MGLENIYQPSSGSQLDIQDLLKWQGQEAPTSKCQPFQTHFPSIPCQQKGGWPPGGFSHIRTQVPHGFLPVVTSHSATQNP